MAKTLKEMLAENRAASVTTGKKVQTGKDKQQPKPQPANIKKRTALSQNSDSTLTKHILSWIVLLAGIPVIVLVMAIWYIIASWIVGLLSEHFSWLYEWFLGDHITEIITVLSGLLLFGLANRTNKLSYGIYPSKYATRYLVMGVISGILTIFGAICTLLGYIPLSIPFQLGRGIIFSISYAMGIYTYQIILGGIRARKISKSSSNQIQTICVFGYVEKRPNAPFQPFCYITDSPGLMNPDGSLNSNRGTDQAYLRRYLKMKQVALDAQNCPSDAYKHNLLAYLGFIAGERVYFTDMFSIDTLTGKDSYTNLYMPNDQKNVQGVELAVLKGKKHFVANADGTFISKDGRVFSPAPIHTATANTQLQKSSKPIVTTEVKTTQTKPQQKTVKQITSSNASVSKSVDKPRIYLFCDSSLTSEDRSLVTKVISEVCTLFPMCEVINMDTSPGAESNRKSADTFLQGTFNKNGQADGAIIIRKLQNAYNSLPNATAVVLLTAKDLFSSSLKLSWCFGTANYQKHVSVHSVFRYQSLTKEEKLRCIRRTLRHELGHIFGLANDLRRSNTENYHGHHCTAPGCSMRQTGTLRELLQYSAEEERVGTFFCKDCISDLNRYFSESTALQSRKI